MATENLGKRGGSEKPRIGDSIGRFVHAHRPVLLVGTIVVVVGIVVTAVVVELATSRANRATEKIELILGSFAAWQELNAEDDSFATTADGLLADLATIGAEYADLFAGQHAEFLRGRVLAELDNWSAAATAFGQAFAMDKKSLLAPISLLNQGLSLEAAGLLDESTAVLANLVDAYGDQPVDLPRALFALGRIAETQSRYSDAKLYYDLLLDEHPNSSWTNLARNRIVRLTTSALL